jgi:hypothetical protein
VRRADRSAAHSGASAAYPDGPSLTGQLDQAARQWRHHEAERRFAAAASHGVATEDFSSVAAATAAGWHRHGLNPDLRRLARGIVVTVSHEGDPVQVVVPVQ